MAHRDTDYKVLMHKLRRGMALSNRDFNAAAVANWPKNSRILYTGAEKAGVLEGLGDDLVEQFKTGTWAPDELLGISVKTILAGLVVLMVVRAKSRRMD